MNKGQCRSILVQSLRARGTDVPIDLPWKMLVAAFGEPPAYGTATRLAYDRARHMIGDRDKRVAKRQAKKTRQKLVKRTLPVAVVKSETFYASKEWRRLRYIVLKASDGMCELCGALPAKGKPLHVDHIKPRSKHPELALVRTNLQVLCEDCNMGKSNRDETDWRDRAVRLVVDNEPSLSVLMGERMA